MRAFLPFQFLLLFTIVVYTSSKSDTNTRNETAHNFSLGTHLRVGSAPKPPPSTLNFLTALSKARQKAISGGLSGFIAGAVQVITLMWLRTTVNYQYRYGVSMAAAIRELYRQGGVSRFYRGLPYALLQGPLARLGGIAANDASIVFAAYFTGQSDVMKSSMLSTAIGSILAGLWRIVLMPIDTCKTVLQVDGTRGFKFLSNRVRKGDISVLYTGAMATTLATMISHYPWFIVHNSLDQYLPNKVDIVGLLFRSSFIGFCSSAVSDTISNSIRVIKTVKQASTTKMTYRYHDNPEFIYTVLLNRDVILKVHAEGGLKGIFGRGLKTRILTNGLQSMLFTVIWKLMSRKVTLDKGEKGGNEEKGGNGEKEEKDDKVDDDQNTYINITEDTKDINDTIENLSTPIEGKSLLRQAN